MLIDRAHDDRVYDSAGTAARAEMKLRALLARQKLF
jgi:hypothetical protein